jgi:phosphoserine phosphatase
MTQKSDYTGLILISGEDQPGITAGLMRTLAPFSILILSSDQLVTRGRLIQTTLISLNRDHAPAIEADLMEFAASHELDLAIDFSEIPRLDLISHPWRVITLAQNLSPALLADVTGILHEAGATISHIRMVESEILKSVEYRLIFAGEPEKVSLQKLISQAASNHQATSILHNSSPTHQSQLVMLDVDSTLIEQEVIDQLAIKAGVGDQVAAITEAAMRGELDFESSLRSRVSLLAGAPASIIEEVRSEINLTPGAQTLISTLHAMGRKVGVVSGGFTNLIDGLAKELQLDFARANTLEIIDGVITGNLLGPIITRAGKAEALKEFAVREGISLERTIAIGDGANDLDMLEVAGVGIAFCAKPAVAEAADIAIYVKDLSTVLTLMGYEESEITRIV